MRASFMRNCGIPEALAAREAMAKAPTKLTAQERVILFCVATGIDYAAVGILTHAMQSMSAHGFITHDRESGAYALTDSGPYRDSSRCRAQINPGLPRATTLYPAWLKLKNPACDAARREAKEDWGR
jgi:hypothetical protein